MKILQTIGAFFKKIWAIKKHYWQIIFSAIRRGFLKVVLFFKTSKIFDFARKPITKKIAIIFLLVVILLQAALVVLIYGFKSENKFTRIGAAIVPYPVAIVNQDFVTYDEYLNEKDYIHHFYTATQQQGIDYSTIDQQVLDQLVENKLLAFQAFCYHEKVSGSDVDAALNQIIEQNGGQDKVGKVLEDLYGLNLNDFKALVKTQLIREKLNSDLIETATVRHILVKVDQNAPADQIAAAKTKIDGYLTQINSGSISFSDAAKKYSDDTGSASNGGLLDPFSPGEMVQPFSDIAFSTPVGKIAGPFRTQYGWHILQVESRTGKINESFDDWLSNLKKHSLIIKFIK